MSSELCPVLDALNGCDVVTAPIIDRCGLWSRDKAWCSSLSTPASAMLQALHCRADWCEGIAINICISMYIDICIDMRIDMRIDMCIDM